MRDRPILLRMLQGAYRRATAPWKSRLDRRYLTRDESAIMLRTLQDNLSSLRSESRDHQDLLAATDRRVVEGEIALTDLSDAQAAFDIDVRERLVALETGLRERLVTLGADIERLKAQTAENGTEAAKGSAFVAHEEPHALRKKLFDSHRLAREGAEAIESLLQAELLLWQATDAADAADASPESEAVGG